MDSDFIIRLTFGLYRVTELLFGDSALRRTIEESASRLLVNLILLSDGKLKASSILEGRSEAAPRALTELETLLGLLQDMKRLRVINDRNFVVLEREYAKVRRFLIQNEEQPPSLRPPNPRPSPSFVRADALHKQSAFRSKELNSRQEKMLEILRYKEKVQVWELKKLLPDVTKRTLRRDVDDLLKRNLVVREGEWNDIFYRSVDKVLGTVGQR